jgi:hypothetical protein
MEANNASGDKCKVMVVGVSELVRTWGIIRLWLDQGGEVQIQVYKKPRYTIKRMKVDGV